ncbi:MAG TPA: hypothetical protein PKH78_14020, partial [Candidatus Obscuribacter sp.]|nr:hypothetical protein [Candidatus Obscuribacter sp.]
LAKGLPDPGFGMGKLLLRLVEVSGGFSERKVEFDSLHMDPKSWQFMGETVSSYSKAWANLLISP